MVRCSLQIFVAQTVEASLCIADSSYIKVTKIRFMSHLACCEICLQQVSKSYDG